MSKQITRRDFLNGVSVGIAGTAMIGPQNLLAEAVKSQSGIANKHYPPTLNGIRGSHEGSFEVSHALAWRKEKPSHYAELKEPYDLVIVGAGISGLAAALFYQQLAGQDKRILILDNHDDFAVTQDAMNSILRERCYWAAVAAETSKTFTSTLPRLNNLLRILVLTSKQYKRN